MGSTIDFNHIFFGRHEGHHKIITAVILIVLVAFGSYYFFARNTPVPANTSTEPVAKKSPQGLLYSYVDGKNPALSIYSKSSSCIPGLGVIYSSPANNKTKLSFLTFNGELIGLIFSWPGAEGWAPYADQPEGKPINPRGLDLYTQTIRFITPPSDADCASGKTLEGTRTLRYDSLSERNPSLSLYSRAATCRENLGFVYGLGSKISIPKSRLNILTFNGEIIGALISWPSPEGWAPYANQPEGKPINTGGAEIYTQTIYFKDPPTKDDCNAISS